MALPMEPLKSTVEFDMAAFCRNHNLIQLLVNYKVQILDVIFINFMLAVSFTQTTFLSPSVLDLQYTQNICGLEGNLPGMSFNAKKSYCLVLGSHCNLNLPAMSINGLYLSWVDRISSPGFAFSEGKLSNVDVTHEWGNFFSLVN
jgi:hypothetical protein